jgi:hypothetical protein
VKISDAGRYLVPLKEFASGRGLTQKENITKLAVAQIAKDFGTKTNFFSTAGHADFNYVPFYHDIFDDYEFTNYAHREEDY